MIDINDVIFWHSTLIFTFMLNNLLKLTTVLRFRIGKFSLRLTKVGVMTFYMIQFI